MYSFTFLLVLSVQTVSTFALWPCPFNKECDCTNERPIPSPLIYDYVECNPKDGKLPKFDPSPDGKYVIRREFIIKNADLRVIPAKHFAAFERLGYVRLVHKSKSPVESADIDWDDSAFDGVQLIGVAMNGLDGLIPVPAALKNTNSTYLNLYNGHTPISLKDNSFENIPNLQSFSIYNITIQDIKPNAFFGLEDVLQKISLTSAGIRDIASLKDAIKNMKNLNVFDLSYNSIAEVKSESFPEIFLNSLILDANPIKNIDKKSFSTLKGLRDVSLMNVQTLTTIDLATFSGLNTTALTVTFLLDRFLKNVVVSDEGEFANQTTFRIGYTGLETIDPIVADLMQKYPGMFLYLNSDAHLKCEGLEWMSKIDCPARMWIDGSKCSDKQGQKLVDYLKSVDPESKCKEKESLPRLLQTRQHWIEHRQQLRSD